MSTEMKNANPIGDKRITDNNLSASVQIKRLLDEINEPYSMDNSNRIQATVEAMRKLNNYSKSICGLLPDYCTAVFTITPSPVYFLRKWLSLECNYQNTFQTKQEASETITISMKRILLHNRFFSIEALRQLNELWGLRMRAYSVKIKVKESAIIPSKTLYGAFALPKPSNGVFTYTFKIKENIPIEENNAYMMSNKWQIDTLLDIFSRIFGKENISSSYEYSYSFDSHIYFTQFLPQTDYHDFFEEISQITKDHHYIINSQHETMGIDFNWREKDVFDIRDELCQTYDYIEAFILKNHRCKFEIQEA